ncbi:MAG: SMC-Scp complex subunit ScpB [Rhodospirillaceae bacterium]|nr:SMC-Scp complex subunit ScpB [Rhodospirillaceae bacterium]
MTDSRFETLRLIEAVLFASTEPVSENTLKQWVSDDLKLRELLEELQGLYANRGVHLVHHDSRWAFRTAPDLAPQMKMERKVTRRLSRAGIETLAIISYHQPVTRAEIEEIRGVGLSRGTLEALLEAGWIKPKGHRETPGRPATWGTTDAFLEHFGLEGLDALPGVEELRAAGLLDKRPAIAALGLTGGLLPGENAEDEEEEGGNGDDGPLDSDPEAPDDDDEDDDDDDGA